MNIISKAAENLRGHWYQGYYYDTAAKSEMCGIGHVLVAAGYNLLEEDPLSLVSTSGLKDAIEVMSAVAAEQFPERVFDPIESPMGCGFVAFNDHPDTTEDEVVAVLEKAAIKWDEQI